MNTTKQLTTHGPGASHANRAAVINHNRAKGDANYAAAQLTTTPVIVCELRAHGNFVRACAAAGTNVATLWDWRKRDPALNRDVRLAVQFAASDAVDYAVWSVTR